LNLLASSSHRREEREHKSCIACIQGVVWFQRIYRQKCAFNGRVLTMQQYRGLQPGRSHECVAVNNVFTSTILDEGATATSWYTLTIGNTLCAIPNCFGVAQATRTQLFSTPVQAIDKQAGAAVDGGTGLPHSHTVVLMATSWANSCATDYF
jgi:hypothetical protein